MAWQKNWKDFSPSSDPANITTGYKNFFDYADKDLVTKTFLFTKAYCDVLTGHGVEVSFLTRGNNSFIDRQDMREWEKRPKPRLTIFQFLFNTPPARFWQLWKARIQADLRGIGYETYVDVAWDYQQKYRDLTQTIYDKAQYPHFGERHGYLPSIQTPCGPRFLEFLDDYLEYYRISDALTLNHRRDLYQYDPDQPDSVEYQRRALSALEAQAKKQDTFHYRRALCSLIDSEDRCGRLSLEYVCSVRPDLADSVESVRLRRELEREAEHTVYREAS